MPVQVHIVAGHLGAGKTSVLRHLLSQAVAGERVGVVVNDFGEAAIDAALLGSASATTREIRGSCVCCTAPEGFAASVGELLDQVDRLFVEPTGLARPSDLIDTLRRAPYADRIALGPLVVVVDPRELASGRVPHDAVDQLAAAEIVVANRCDLASDRDLAALHDRLGALWPGPVRVHETTHGQVPPTVLAPSDGQPRRAPHAHAHHHGDHASARSLILSADRVYSREALVRWLASAPLLRAKGLFRTDEGWRVVQLAGGEVSVEPTSWRADNRMDAIAADAAALERLEADLERCRAARAEEGLIELAWPSGTRTFDREALLALPDRVGDVASRFPKRAGAGASLRALLASAGAPLEGTLVVAAADGFTSDPVDVRDALDGVIVDTLDDAGLPASQGGPFRLLVPGSVPCANVKAVTRLVVR
ncbi:MAG: GTP-binding protein [Alphaproteobacteria bacterium]|nr:GTP-binding protein [Alphaproteobacteria bacterium]MCB9699551.1 GTP-binding protein [Alphaproteobacteria bacterium]